MMPAAVRLSPRAAKTAAPAPGSSCSGAPISIPGTEVFPGENSDHKYAYPSNYSASNVLNNTAFGGNQSALPDMWTLPGRNNPWIGY